MKCRNARKGESVEVGPTVKGATRTVKTRAGDRVCSLRDRNFVLHLGKSGKAAKRARFLKHVKGKFKCKRNRLGQVISCARKGR